LRKLIAGLAKLGEIYLRIMAKIDAFYKEEPVMKFEAAKVALRLGYGKEPASIREVVDSVLGEEPGTEPPINEQQRELLYSYAEKYMDPVLAEETAREYVNAPWQRRRADASGNAGADEHLPGPGTGHV